MEEKKAIVKVHERLVKEAEEEHKEKTCLEVIEKAMATYQECELKVLRVYVEQAESYPTSWTTFLAQKKHCP